MKISALLIAILFCVLSGAAHAQTEKLLKYEKRLKDKIQLGMTTSEVRKLLGSPKSIEGGFPNSEDYIISEIPDQVGQLNNSTWFYNYPIIVSNENNDSTFYYVNGIEVTESEYKYYRSRGEVMIGNGEVYTPGELSIKSECRLNGEDVDPDIYREYRSDDSIYYYNGHVASKKAAESYLIPTYPSDVTKQPKDLSKSYLRQDTLDLDGNAMHPQLVKKTRKTTYSRTSHKVIRLRLMPIFCVIFDRGTQVVAATRMYFYYVP